MTRDERQMEINRYQALLDKIEKGYELMEAIGDEPWRDITERSQQRWRDKIERHKKRIAEDERASSG